MTPGANGGRYHATDTTGVQNPYKALNLNGINYLHLLTWSDTPPLCIAKRTRVHELEEEQYCIVKFPPLGWVLWLCPSLHQGKIASLKLLFIDVSVQVRSVFIRRGSPRWK